MATEVVLLRAAQESLGQRAQAAASAGHVDLTRPRDPTVLLTVADDGAGFDRGRADGYGLRGMRARAAQVGGR